MGKSLPVLLDAPEKQTIGVGLIYSVICFLSLPFILLLSSIGLENNAVAMSWIEIAFHAINFAVVFGLFREYLSYAWVTVRTVKDTLISVVAITVGIMLGLTMLWYLLLRFTQLDIFYYGTFSTLPITEMDILSLSGSVIVNNPIFGTICMVTIVPVVTSCLYYAIGFTPAYNSRPWLGYAVVALLIAFPRFCNAITFWDPATEIMLYLVQLPVHMVSCWAYQKTDTVWAPIFSHMAANLIACIVLIFLYVL